MVNERTHRVIPTTARDDGAENAQPGLREGPPIGRYGRPIAAHPPPPPRALPVPPGRTAAASPLGRAATRPSATPRPVAQLATRPSATPRPVAHLATRRTRATGHLATDHRRRAGVAALAASLALAGCAVGGSGTPNPALVAATAAPATPVTATPPPVSPTPSAAAAPGCVDGPWSCPQQQRFAEVTAYTRRTVGAHGYLSVVFTDRVTGATWRTGDTAHPGWTASTDQARDRRRPPAPRPRRTRSRSAPPTATTSRPCSTSPTTPPPTGSGRPTATTPCSPASAPTSA